MEKRTRLMVDRQDVIEALEAKCALLAASLKQSDNLVAAAQTLLAQHHEPVGPSKADTIKALTELLSDASIMRAERAK